MSLEIINTLVTLGQNTYDFLGIVGCASAANGIKNFLRQKAPFLYSDWKFWDNVDKFFNGGILSDSDKQNLILKLSDTENAKDNGNEIIGIIKKVNSDKKLAYILNATKALANSRIELNIYFRICHVVLNTLEEDLQFLNQHIEEKNISYSIEVSGLMISGLTYNKVMSETNEPFYVFTKLAEIVNEYALKGDGQKRIEEFNLNMPPQNIFLRTTTDEEFAEYLNDIFNQTSKQ